MTKMSTGKIERIAVEAIRREANQPSSKLVAKISEGDKDISIDGEIQIFKDKSETVDSLLGKIPVQVKGTQVESFSNSTISFSLKLGHYKNYYNSNGIILFVVEILNTSETKIFYKQLLPQPQVLIEKKPFPENYFSSYSLTSLTLDLKSMTEKNILSREQLISSQLTSDNNVLPPRNIRPTVWHWNTRMLR